MSVIEKAFGPDSDDTKVQNQPPISEAPRFGARDVDDALEHDKASTSVETEEEKLRAQEEAKAKEIAEFVVDWAFSD